MFRDLLKPSILKEMGMVSSEVISRKEYTKFVVPPSGGHAA
ncbi:hypothetical protein QUF80_01095 [Desulfococcaceae bacterium HSG8]|nr:hypothetical protein [Desulfococcaceae bacterium HSG8]